MNPYDIDNAGGVFAAEFTTVQTGVVTSAPSHSVGDDTTHVVTVKPFTAESEVDAEVRIGMRGDAMIPSEGSVVYVGWRVDGDAVVLGGKYPDNESPPAFEPGERVIGHPASDTHVRFRTDGSLLVSGASGNTIELASDGTISVNDGTTAPITDVSTTTDGDGHVTGVSLSRATGVFVPSE